MPEVLVVEDETNLARFIELELGHEGYNVTLAQMGRRVLIWRMRMTMM